MHFAKLMQKDPERLGSDGRRETTDKDLGRLFMLGLGNGALGVDLTRGVSVRRYELLGRQERSTHLLSVKVVHLFQDFGHARRARIRQEGETS